MNRRQFLLATGGTAAFLGMRRRGFAFGQSPRGIPKFDATLPGLGPAGANNYGNYIPVLSPDTTRFRGVDYYEIAAQQFTQTLHPSIGSTRFWGYADAATPENKYLGGVIVAKRNRPVKLNIVNNLPRTHILPVDPTTIDPPMVAEVGGRVDRIAVHLHGGLVHWTSDGGPCAWFSNASPSNGGFVYGSSFLNAGLYPSAVYDYPNDQSARLLWYHDHAYGNTRLNAYSGIASAYLITDDSETNLVNSGTLPNIPGYPLGIPLVLQDKTFFDPGSDPHYPVSSARKGDLWYPWKYEANPPQGHKSGRWDLDPAITTTDGLPPISCIPESFSDTILVNGAPYPRLPVAPRRFRFRLLNACQARFLNLQLYVADSSPDGITLRASSEVDPEGLPLQIPTNAAGPKIIQIGNECGFLPAPAVLNAPPQPIGFNLPANQLDPKYDNATRYNLLLAPAERADIIVDFSGFAGRRIVLYNDAPAPFPGGDNRNDYYAGAPNLSSIGGVPSPPEGSGPDTRVLMRFDVSTTGDVTELNFDQTLNRLKGELPGVFLATQPHAPSTFAPAKAKTLNEDFDDFGRLRQRLGATAASDYLSMPTEVVSNHETQVWQIYNLTGDTHPMHFHLVNVQILKREAWRFNATGDPILPLAPIPGSARQPDANERGHKETVRMNPGEVVTVAMRFDLPPGRAPDSPRLRSSYGLRGAEYVWHCHILEHEEHDMMHALVVV
jgi:spore coat protein A, manganese oxidase